MPRVRLYGPGTSCVFWVCQWGLHNSTVNIKLLSTLPIIQCFTNAPSILRLTVILFTITSSLGIFNLVIRLLQNNWQTSLWRCWDNVGFIICLASWAFLIRMRQLEGEYWESWVFWYYRSHVIPVNMLSCLCCTFLMLFASFYCRDLWV